MLWHPLGFANNFTLGAENLAVLKIGGCQWDPVSILLANQHVESANAGGQ